MVVVGGFVCVLPAWNDTMNSLGAPYCACALTMKQSLLIAAVFEFVGAFALGSHVSETIRKGIAELELYPGLDGWKEIVAGIFCTLYAATLWQGFATKFSLPVSTTHSIVGGVLGFAIVSRGYGAPDWEKIVGSGVAPHDRSHAPIGRNQRPSSASRVLALPPRVCPDVCRQTRARSVAAATMSDLNEKMRSAAGDWS